MEIYKNFSIWKISVFVMGIIIMFTQFYDVNVVRMVKEALRERADAKIENMVVPPGEVVLPISWEDLGDQMVQVGVIDERKFEELYVNRDQLYEAREVLYGSEFKISRENSDIALNVLWAFGISNKNIILEEGPMMDEQYGGDAGRFASTGGWSLSVGSPMDYYSKFEFVTLSSEQQARVENVSKHIYRPCCNNSTFFPDCNHGMAMLGLLQLLAVQDLSEQEMYDVALKVNSLWFPDTYIAIAHYLDKKGIEWEDVDAKQILDEEFSSSSGYQGVLAEITPPTSTQSQGGGCGV
jgi:hypothetical protein